MMKSLKEWATIIRALECGEQTVLLRKGGILEASSGFIVESDKFLLFPTVEHQGYSNIKEQFHGLLDRIQAEQRQEDGIMLTSYARVLADADLHSVKIIEELSKFHIWSKSYVDERIKWKAEKPIKALFLQVYNIPPLTVDMNPEYRGCKSWIDVDTQIPDGKSVLSKTEIESRLEEFRKLVH